MSDDQAATREIAAARFPVPMPQLSRRHLCVFVLVAALHGHGMGRHSAEPTTLDASARAFLANLLWAPVDSPLQRPAASRPTLEAYCRRMKACYYA